MKKKIISIFLVALMALSSAACGNNDVTTAVASDSAAQKAQEKRADSEEPALLRIFMYDQKSVDDAKVAEYVSNLDAVKKLGVKVEFVKFAKGEYTDKIPLLLASNEQMDIGFTQGTLDYVNFSNSNGYVDITDKLDSTAPALKKAIPEVLWNGMKINGRIYGVPTYKELGEQYAFYADTEFLNETGFKPSEVTSYADGEKILKKLENTDRARFMVRLNQGKTINNMYMISNYDMVSDFAAIERSEGKTILNPYESKGFNDFAALMRDWNKKGYVSADAVTRENYDEFWRNGNHKYGLGFVGYAPFNEVTFSGFYGKSLTPMEITPIVIGTNSTRGSIFSIYSKSKNQEKSLKFLEAWNTVPEVKNAICYGIEGVHYNLVNGQVERVKNWDSLYYAQNWTTGNSMISYTLVGEPVDKWDQYLSFNNKAINSCALGFSPDNKGLEDKIAACTAAQAEYLNLIAIGAVDPAESLPKFKAALKSAGIDDIIAEYQKQFDKWKSNK